MHIEDGSIKAIIAAAKAEGLDHVNHQVTTGASNVHLTLTFVKQDHAPQNLGGQITEISDAQDTLDKAAARHR